MFSYKDVLAIMKSDRTYRAGDIAWAIARYKGHKVYDVSTKLFQMFERGILTRKPTYSRNSNVEKHTVLYYEYKLKSEEDGLLRNGFQTNTEYNDGTTFVSTLVLTKEGW